MRDTRRGVGAFLKPYWLLVAACAGSLILRPTTLSALTGIDPAPVDLAKQAYAENLPQISVAVLRTQIQEERDPVKKMELIRRLVDLLVTGGRYSEALDVIASQDAENDPKFAFWKGVSLLGTGDAVTCLLYTSPSPRDRQKSRMPSSA